MEGIFIKLLNNSLAASWLVLAVLLLRPLLKKAPKNISCLLWGLVGLRLILPVRLKSAFSLIPSAMTVSPDIVYAKSPVIDSGISSLNRAINPVISETFRAVPHTSANPLQIWLFIAAVLWLCGAAALLLYSLISYLRLKKGVAAAVVLEDDVRQCAGISSPFVLGLFRPRIYLPTGLSEEDTPFVLAHERAHIKRRDHWLKFLGFLLLSFYWFNPLLWAAYALLCRDIELACDEAVLRSQGAGIKKAYSAALLHCSVSRRRVAACPVAFGEAGIKQRIKSVLRYKKPALWSVIAAGSVCAVLALCFLTDPAGLRLDLEENPISAAESVDLRLSEPYEREMSPAQLEELSSRLRLLSGSRKSAQYEGMTSVYTITVSLKDGEDLLINGYSANKDIIDIQYKGTRYVSEDADFNAYVNRFCIGADTEEARRKGSDIYLPYSIDELEAMAPEAAE